MNATGPEPFAPPRKENFYLRLFRSRRVRIFFLASVILHGIMAAVVISNKTMYDMVFGETKLKEVEAAPWELQRAIDQLTGLYVERFNKSLAELVSIRASLEALTIRKYENLKTSDKDREEKIARKAWPSAQRPDKFAKYVPMADVERPRFVFDPLPDTGRMGLVELFRLHSPVEKQIGKVYEVFHAMELSDMAEDPIPLSQALKNTKLALPPRRDIQLHLLDTSKITSSLGEPFKLFKRELIDAYLETQDMVNTAKRWLEVAESKDKGTVLETKFGLIMNVVPPPQPYYGHYLNPRLLARRANEKMIEPTVFMGNRIGRGDLTQPAEWISIDRWWCIGPFAHPGATRRMSELERKYPPEDRVDLDGVYEGKASGGKTRLLRWKYRHTSTDYLEKGVRFEPYTVDNEAYAVWYFYTEVWSDKDQVVLGSFASDDYGVCWVAPPPPEPGMLPRYQTIYKSPPDTQPWVPFTRYGFRPVPLRKGFNRFRFKLENATGTTAFSVVLMTYEDKELIAALKDAN